MHSQGGHGFIRVIYLTSKQLGYVGKKSADFHMFSETFVPNFEFELLQPEAHINAKVEVQFPGIPRICTIPRMHAETCIPRMYPWDVCLSIHPDGGNLHNSQDAC